MGFLLCFWISYECFLCCCSSDKLQANYYTFGVSSLKVVKLTLFSCSENRVKFLMGLPELHASEIINSAIQIVSHVNEDLYMQSVRHLTNEEVAKALTETKN